MKLRFFALAVLLLALAEVSQAQSSHSVSLSCTAPGDFSAGDSFNFYRGTVTGGPYTKINTASVTVCAFTDLTVTEGATYFYVATHVAASSSLESVFSNEVQARILPSPPTSLVATVK